LCNRTYRCDFQNPRDTIPIKPTTNQVLCPQNTCAPYNYWAARLKDQTLTQIIESDKNTRIVTEQA